jgi:hypothetical protein
MILTMYTQEELLVARVYNKRVCNSLFPCRTSSAPMLLTIVSSISMLLTFVSSTAVLLTYVSSTNPIFTSNSSNGRQHEIHSFPEILIAEWPLDRVSKYGCTTCQVIAKMFLRV